MIKKFEEFVNEMYSPYEQRMQNRAKSIKEFVDYLMNLGVSDQDCKEIEVIAKDANFIYTIFGYNEASSGVVYRYDIEKNKWEIYSKKSDPWARTDAQYGVVDGVLYCGGGSSSYMKHDWWRYDWRNNKWYECSKMCGSARVFASSVTIDKNIYVLGGRYFGGTETREHFYQTILVYDVSNDEWHTVGRMEQAAENMIAFEYNGLHWHSELTKDRNYHLKKTKKCEDFSFAFNYKTYIHRGNATISLTNRLFYATITLERRWRVCMKLHKEKES